MLVTGERVVILKLCFQLHLFSISCGLSSSYREGQTSVETEVPSEALPNFDCWDLVYTRSFEGYSQVEEYDMPREVFDDVYTMAAKTAELSQVVQAGVSSESHVYRKGLRQIGSSLLPSLEGHIRSPNIDRFASDCPYGDAVLRFSIWVACRFMALPPTSLELEYWQLHPEEIPETMMSESWPAVCSDVRFGFLPFLQQPATLTTAANSNWIRPFCALASFARPALRQTPASLDVDRLADAKIALDAIDCLYLGEAIGPSGMRWMAFLKDLSHDANDIFNGASGLPKDFLMKVTKYTLAPGVIREPKVKFNECPLGYVSLLLVNLVVVQIAKTQEYLKFREGLSAMLTSFEQAVDSQGGLDPMSFYMVSQWPVVPLFCTMSRGSMADTESGKHGYQHKPFALDFLPEEILRPRKMREDLTFIRNSDRETHEQRLRSSVSHGVSPTYAELCNALLFILSRWQPGQAGVDGTKLVVVTIVWGTRLARYLPGVFKRARAFGLHNRYVVFCLDHAALDVCRTTHSSNINCVSGSLKTIYNKYTIISALVHMGFDALYLDFDTLLVKDPVPFLLDAAESYEIAVSRDFGAQCLNTGVIFFKAHPHVGEFLVSLLVWLWHHPYEFSQKAFSAFLGHEKSTDDRISPMPLEQVPRWVVLDPINAFVTSSVYNYGVEGWTGSMDGIVIFHFLDGTGGVDAARAIEGQYVNLYDLFYDNDNIDLTDPETPLWMQDPRIEHTFLRSRLPAPPETLLDCTLLGDD